MAMSLAKAPLFKNAKTTFERLDKFVSDLYFTDCNLRGRLYGDRAPLTKLIHVDCGQERLSFKDAVQKLEKEGKEVKPGISLGPSWSTHWFKVELNIPSAWDGQRVHFRWDSESEALLWSNDGEPLKGLSSEFEKTDFWLKAPYDRPITLYVEMACNTLFGCGKGDMINPPDADRRFTLKTAEIAVFREDVFGLLMDFDVLIGLAKNLPENSSKRFEIMYFANSLVNKCVPTSSDSIVACHEEANKYLNQLPFQATNFTVYAVGNSHIDTAWLWPYDETKRKCARTFSTVLHLMDQYPDLRFAVSQAQQLDWVRQNYPTLFERIQRKVTEQKFIGVGGCWVEMDGNLPCGESLVRQMLYGQKFYEQYFGRRCTEFWLPDTFGYPSQLPQLITAAGMHRFVTQKLSWNLVNRFPNQTFWWQGLDGTKVLAHFPPADNYCSRVTVEEAVKIDQNFADKGRSRSALLLYGYGDGGGGPDERMLERLNRMKALPGTPNVVPASPNEFFAKVENADLDNLVTWSGELYLELHNGTYTTHAEIKAMNRRCEFLLRDCEFVSAILWANDDAHDRRQHRNWEPEWKNVLLNQFHDVLPGTSIGKVYQDAKRLFEDAISSTQAYLQNPDDRKKEVTSEQLLLNSLPWSRLVELNGKLYKLPPMSMIQFEDAVYVPPDESKVDIFEDDKTVTLRNRWICATIDKATGHLLSLLSFKDGTKEVTSFYDAVRPGCHANRFVLYDDIPLYWDAWDVMDYHLETGRPCESILEQVRVVERGPIKCVAKYVMKIGLKSELRQQIILRAEQPYLEFVNELVWDERHKLLKVDFPWNVRSNEATYEIQFGHIKRPAHRNTSWDSAKFEVCGHKWADVSEHGFGVALLNDCKYGHSCNNGVLNLSIVRGSTAPDAQADIHSIQHFTYAVMPHYGPLQQQQMSGINVIQAAYGLNSPTRVVHLESSLASLVSGSSWFTIDNPAIMVEAIKVAENGKSLILRIYECNGGKAFAQMTTYFDIAKAYRCNLLEDPIDGDVALDLDLSESTFKLFLKAFEVQTLRLDLA